MRQKVSMDMEKYFIYSPKDNEHVLCFGVDSHNADVLEIFPRYNQARSIMDELNAIKKPTTEKLEAMIAFARNHC